MSVPFSDAADRVITKCGGIEETARIVGSSTGWVRRWRYASDKSGTDGRVPPKAQRILLRRREEIPGLTIEDIMGLPRPGE